MTYTYLKRPMTNYLWSDIWALFDELTTSNISSKATQTSINQTQSALSKVIGRPHNTYVEKKDGDIVKYIVETVYTPWKSSDIKCTYTAKDDDPKIVVKIGSEDVETNCLQINEDDTDIMELYHGISTKPIGFEISLANIKVKPDGIKTFAIDGVLRIEISPDISDIPKDISIPVN